MQLSRQILCTYYNLPFENNDATKYYRSKTRPIYETNNTIPGALRSNPKRGYWWIRQKGIIVEKGARLRGATLRPWPSWFTPLVTPFYGTAHCWNLFFWPVLFDMYRTAVNNSGVRAPVAPIFKSSSRPRYCRRNLSFRPKIRRTYRTIGSATL